MALQLTKRGTVSGSAEVASRKYHLHTGKSGRVFLVADQPDPADNIYVSDPDPNSQGFGGATLEFELVTGEVVALKGPWHTNSGHLLDDTGIDIRDKHLTQVVVYERRAPNSMAEGTIYYEEHEPHLGTFDRGKDIAQRIANERGHPVYYFRKSAGGSSDSRVSPA